MAFICFNTNFIQNDVSFFHIVELNIRTITRKPRSVPKSKKNKTLRYDYKIPIDALPSTEIKKLIHIYDVSKPIQTDYACVTLSIRPNVPICLYPTKQGERFLLFFRNFLAVTSHHFVRPQIQAVSDFGWLRPWVLKHNVRNDPQSTLDRLGLDAAASHLPSERVTTAPRWPAWVREVFGYNSAWGDPGVPYSKGVSSRTTYIHTSKNRYKIRHVGEGGLGATHTKGEQLTA